MKLIYATTNPDKFNRARVNLAKHQIELQQYKLSLNEQQIFDGKKIASNKAEQAYGILQTPVIVSDDTWKIPALNGFPGPFMKACNNFLTAQDWLRLMKGKKNRDITLFSHLGYSDGQKVKVFTQQKNAYFLNQPQGKHLGAPHLEIIAWEGATQSVAQEITQGIKPKEDQLNFWQQVATYIKMEQHE